MARFNLWLVRPEGSKVICYGTQEDMNTLAFAKVLSDLGDVHVLPDQEEPITIVLNDALPSQ